MDIIDRVRSEREDLARVLKKHKGIRKLVEDLYPDSAHFIFELLQNAEDTGATEALFQLTKDSLVFEHDGRSFTNEDLEGITDIGDGTKSDDDDTIGQYGVGFKAVFAYSETPHVYSPTLSFRISDLVLPFSIPNDLKIGDRTRFVFEFNNAKKSPELAHEEVKGALEKLPSTTILFLRSLEKIEWSIDGKGAEITQNRYSDRHIEVLKSKGGRKISSSHYLIFSELVNGYKQHHMAVAYELDFLPKSELGSYTKSTPLAKQMKLVAASPGQVAIFFPAEKETSNLKFHLHAPFVPELSRASIKDTEVNDPLFLQLSDVVKRSLHDIKKLGLLARDFLAILPNSSDQIPEKYQPIIDAVITEMNENSLTPNYARGHGAARTLIQAKSSLKQLLSSDDLKYLSPKEDGRNSWAIGVNQKNSRIDSFLSDLDIEEWSLEEFGNFFWERSTSGDEEEVECFEGGSFYEWLNLKDDAWFQLLYSTLEKDADSWNVHYWLHDAPFLRLQNGAYGAAVECFFPEDNNGEDDLFPRIALSTITSGGNAEQKKLARELLERLGVREVGELEQIKLILDERYTYDALIVQKPGEDVYIADLKRFINFVNESSGDATIFSSYLIFKGQDRLWRRPDKFFIDKPYVDSGLSFVFALLEDETKKPLSLDYEDYQIETDSIVSFAKKLSVQFKLEFHKMSVTRNPDWRYLSGVGGTKHMDSGTNRDFDIVGLVKLCKASSLEISKVIWKTLISVNPIKQGGKHKRVDVQAAYSKNAGSGIRYAAAKYIHTLRSEAWVPQDGGRFVKPSDASSALLPEGLAYDAESVWIKAVNFGEDVLKDTEAQALKDEWARETVGTSNQEDLAHIKEFMSLPIEARHKFLESQINNKLPDHESANPSRRAGKVEAGALGAQERSGDVRERTIQVGMSEVKKEAESYLLGQYTNEDDKMICQICKKELPFKVSDGSYYFEKVEFVKGLDRRHHQNYLALCPNHAAMFKHANGSLKELNSDFGGMSGNVLDVELAGRQASIYFTKNHAADIKAVLLADNKENGDANATLEDTESGAEAPNPETIFEPGEKVRVIDGPFADFHGAVEEVNYEKNRLKVTLQIFNRTTLVELEFNQVEKT